MVNYFLDILYQFIIINDHLHFSSYPRQSKILSDINGRRTLRGPTHDNPGPHVVRITRDALQNVNEDVLHFAELAGAVPLFKPIEYGTTMQSGFIIL